ncbi:MAG: 16S rRNA (guanine(966)-N(2))-methyltransferase RsmD [Eubacteriales bacterium]|nr:16S rRNA (guanine(966)-N(2))-methyltransferase RsmD [Eubacteriales bacterium]
MRVIAGTCRSLPLKTLPGYSTRPTQDKIKETLFNVIQTEVPACRFLDLFAGSGAIGIEALSRGAEHCVFVEQNRQAVKVIRENLQFTRLEDKAEVLQMDAVSAVAVLNHQKPFDVVFMDPPYLKDLEKSVLEALESAKCITEDTLFIVEASRETDFSWLDTSPYECVKWKLYKNNEHLFLKRRSEK